ncbi:MAG: radical SAM protein [Dehalococcoidia bacterium]
MAGIPFAIALRQMKLSGDDIIGAIADDYLHLIIFPTEACNFRCIYCYETARGGTMAPGVVESVDKLLRLRSGTLSHLGISWFGGEPLLALEVIRNISHQAMILAKRRDNLVYFADMTTNGFLLKPPVFQELIDLEVRRFQISLDGEGQAHDEKRVLAGGGGTFTQIWNNLKSFRRVKDQFTIVVRIHLAADNYASLAKLINLYAVTFAADKRFKLFIRPLSRLGCPRDSELPVLDEEHSVPLLEQLVRQAKKLGIETMTTDDLLPLCYATRLNSFAVRADGSLNKCTVKLDHPENQVGRIKADGSLRLDREKLFKWTRGLKSGDENELACPLRGI